MIDLTIDISHTSPFLPEGRVASYKDMAESELRSLFDRTGKGSEFLGWVTLPTDIDSVLIDRIEEAALQLKDRVDVFVVTGIGGSYLGARALIEALSNSFNMLLDDRQFPLILYAGHQIDEDYMAELLDLLDNKEYALAVISKSGTTTEPAIAFRLLKGHMEKKYGKKEASKRIIAITDKEKGALKQLADEEGYASFVVPDDIGGRYSVLTPVGLLPIAMAGFDIRKLLQGARAMQEHCAANSNMGSNPVSIYAAARNALYNTGYIIEILVNYHPRLFYLGEWWKQLYGESEGKEGKGIFPAVVGFTTDLHSMGQYIQDGLRQLFETVISVEQVNRTVKIPMADHDADGLNYLAGKPMQYINQQAALGTLLAHIEGGVPNILVRIPAINEHTLGQLIYFFELACGLSGYLLGVNPFDQPGVESYKRNMFALLGKPGFEDETRRLLSKLGL